MEDNKKTNGDNSNENVKKYYDEEERVWTKRKPKKKTEEDIIREEKEEELRRKNNIIKGILYAITATITVSIIFIQVRTVEETDLKGIKILKDTELRTEILNEKTKNKEYSKNIAEIEKKIEEYKKSEITGEKVPEVLKKELEETRLKLGLVDIIGQGVTVTLRDNEGNVISANDILTLVNQLIISGAEAISINGNRFMNNTEIVAVNGKDILINGKKLVGPYKILAIGNKKNLESGITTKDGYINQMLANGKSVEYAALDNIEMPKNSGEVKFKYGRQE